VCRWYDGEVCTRPGVVLGEAYGGSVGHVHPVIGPQQRAALASAARLAMQHPDRYLAGALVELRDEDLSAELACHGAWVWWLRLLGSPRLGQWHPDVQRMATAVGAHARALGALPRWWETS
jgi:hypothetical protein